LLALQEREGPVTPVSGPKNDVSKEGHLEREKEITVQGGQRLEEKRGSDQCRKMERRKEARREKDMFRPQRVKKKRKRGREEKEKSGRAS